MVYKFLRITISDNERIRKKGDNRSVMPLDVLGRARYSGVYNVFTSYVNKSGINKPLCSKYI